MLQHFRLAIRLLRKNLSFTLIAVTTLALGIGATTAVFTLVDSVLLRPLGYQNPSQLVSISASERSGGGGQTAFSVLELDDLRAQTDVFEQVSAVWPVSANVTGGSHPERIELLVASPSYFSILGVGPELGRVFGPQDEAAGFAEAVLISDAAWHRLFGADPKVLGRRLYIDNDAYTIVGVMPPGFRHPGKTVAGDVDFWATAGYKADPFPHPPQRAQRFVPGAMARLKPGVSVSAAQARINNLVAQLRQQYPSNYPAASGWTLDLTPLDEVVVGNTRSLLWILLAAVAAILLIGCINVANLLLSRASSREREIAVRLALGASRRDLLQQLLAESLALSAIATIAGVLLGWGMLRAIVAIASAKLPRIEEVSLNSHVLAFVIVLAFVTAVLFGLFPALQSSSPSLVSTIGGGSRSAGASRRQNRTREGLVVAEVGMSLVLLAAAGLLGRTLWRLVQVDPGFDAKNVEVARVWLPVPNNPKADRYAKREVHLALTKEVLRRVNALPGVQEAAITSILPLTADGFQGYVNIEGRTTDLSNAPLLPIISVSPAYFHVLRTPLIEGRVLADTDDSKSQDVVIADQAAVRQFWPHEDPIGRRVGFTFGVAKPRWFTVVGVVGNIRQSGLDSAATPHLFFSLFQGAPRTLSVVARMNASAGGDRSGMSQLGEQMKREIQSVDPDLPVFGIEPMSDLVSASLTRRRFSAELIGTFSMLALLLAAIGVYGVIAFWVAQRTREIGVRMALGAQPADVLRLVLGRGMRLALAGVAVGLLTAICAGPLLRSQLYGISIIDPLVFAIVPALLLLVALFAGYVPALRAMRVDPVVALRYE